MKQDLLKRLSSEPDLSSLLPLLEELFDSVSNIVFFMKNAEGRYISANRTLAERCGYSSASELSGKTAADVFPGSMGQSYLKQDLDIIKSAKKITDRLELHLYSSGRQGWCLTTKIPMFAADGSVIGLIGISQDLQESDGSSHYREISEAVEYIRQNYSEQISIKRLAEMSGISVYQFEKRMKRIFQITAGRYIIKVRIDAGCELLQRTDNPIADIAIVCGYSDQSAFTRQFKAVTGLTPSAYRAAGDNHGGK